MAQEPLGGGTDARPPAETLAQTGPGLPDEAIGPEERSIPRQLELFDDSEARRMEQNMRTELAGLHEDDEGAMDDPTGHA